MKTNTIKNFPIKNELNTKDDGDSKKTFVTNKCHEADALVLDTFQFLEYSRQFDLFSNHSISQCVDLLHTLHEKNQTILKKLEKEAFYFKNFISIKVKFFMPIWSDSIPFQCGWV